MPERIFVLPELEKKEYAELSDPEKIERLEEALRNERIRDAERKAYLTARVGEMRGALHAIIGYATVACSDFQDSACLQEDFDIIVSRSKEIAGILSEVKRRLKSGDFSEKQLEKQKRWDFLLHHLGEMLQPDLLQKNLTMNVDFSEVLHMRVGFELFKIQQILWNLLENAVQYTPENGEIFLRVSERREKSSQKRFYEIRIRDTGIGMHEEFLPHVFESYVREDRPEVMEINGEGIGLTLVKRTVDWLRGTIEVKSVVDGGTTFIVTLPAPDAENSL